MDTGLITEQIRGIAERVVSGGPIELVHVGVTGNSKDLVVRIFIDKEGGVTLDDCSEVSRQVEAVLDAEDTIPSRYVLEVSSPGIERELYALKDFERFTGRLAKLKMKKDFDGPRTLTGSITAVDGDSISIDDRTQGPLTIRYADVDKANLKIELGKEFGKKR